MPTNSILTPDVIAKASAHALHNQTGFTRTINRQIDGEFGIEGKKIGDTIRVRVPSLAGISTGPNLNAESFVERAIFVQLTDANQIHSDVQFTTKELTLKIDDFMERVAKPRVNRIASEIDRLTMANTIPRVGTTVVGSGTNGVLTYLDFLKAGALLDMQTCPREDRSVYIMPKAQVPVANENIKLFNPQSDISGIYASGYIGSGADADWHVSSLMPNYPKLPTGALTSTYTVASVTVGDGSTIASSYTTIVITANIANGTVFKAGTVFGLNSAGGVPIYMINPETKVAYEDQPAQFSLIEDATVAAGSVTFKIGYPLFAANDASNQGNVSVLPAAGFTIPVSGADNVGFVGNETTALSQAVIYHKDAFTFTTAPLIKPDGVDQSGVHSEEGYSIRYLRQYLIGSDALPARWDVLYAAALLRPEFAVRVVGKLP